MFVEHMLNQDSAPLLEQVVKFTARRHRLIAQNIANIDTPNYRQKDLSVKGFQEMLAKVSEARREHGAMSARFDADEFEVETPGKGILSHDGNNRSMEQLATDLAKNALMHNMAIELLGKQIQQMEMALKERIT